MAMLYSNLFTMFGVCRMNMDEKLSTLVQMFWLGASLLESDYEHEFLLAVNLLKQVNIC